MKCERCRRQLHEDHFDITDDGRVLCEFCREELKERSKRMEQANGKEK
jgi:hypothetical protein